MLEVAIKVATKAHQGQFDKAGQPYILHPLTVAAMLDSEAEKTVALLHDVLEDSDLSTSDLKSYGFRDDIIDAVVTLTHRDNETYESYLHRVKSNPLARKVKLADLEHNSDVTRLQVVTEKDRSRLQKYAVAIRFLNE